MDEMMNMNETTMENETSVEVVPEENVQMIDNEETSSNGSGIGLAVGAVGLVAAIPAVVIYNIFARTITSYRHQVGDVAAQIILLQGRDLDLAASEGNAPRGQTGQLRVG